MKYNSTLGCIFILVNSYQIFTFDDGETIPLTFLSLTSSVGPTQVLEHILSKKPQLNSPREGGLPLTRSIATGYKDGFDVLLPHFRSVNIPDCYRRTPAFIAVEYNQESMLKELIERGADLEIDNIYGDFPLDIAMRNKKNQLIDMLIRAGANTEKWSSNKYVLQMLSIIEQEKSRSSKL